MYKKYKDFLYSDAPNCLNCTYFKVSWDPKFPRTCTKFGFKGQNMPCKTVFETTGEHCPVFLARTSAKK